MNTALAFSGTPVQSNVNEVWATFDFLMPNFLGTEASFFKEFAKPVIKSQAPDACAHDIDQGLDSLKILHQQVLPFILRREKMQVMKELPPKTITDVPCQLSKEQLVIYQDILKMSRTKDALEIVEDELREKGDSSTNVSRGRLIILTSHHNMLGTILIGRHHPLRLGEYLRHFSTLDLRY